MLKQVSKEILTKEISRVKVAQAKSSSLRATIPQRIVEGLKLEANDIIEWELYTDKGKTFARIRKSE